MSNFGLYVFKKTFYKKNDLETILTSLVSKGYLSAYEDKYNPVAGNMSFEVFKFLDPESISITLTASDTNRLGIVQNGRARKMTPREWARLQGFPDDFNIPVADASAYKQFGNSVAVPAIQATANKIIQKLLSYDSKLRRSEKYYKHKRCKRTVHRKNLPI